MDVSQMGDTAFCGLLNGAQARHFVLRQRVGNTAEGG